MQPLGEAGQLICGRILSDELRFTSPNKPRFKTKGCCENRISVTSNPIDSVDSSIDVTHANRQFFWHDDISSLEQSSSICSFVPSELYFPQLRNEHNSHTEPFIHTLLCIHSYIIS